ncbi:ArnT family glycosyltransferase [Almyronema epifaneia S1]|uniref:ArnT family glycosyltransferase n=1 Tax=Almyronema epifaneia S1 TaxID=2991925 RepID=A0ABW6I9Z2_9CYAN
MPPLYKRFLTADPLPTLSLLAFTGCLCLLHFSPQTFMPHDEGWYAQQARWFLETGDWVTLRWWDTVIFDRCIGLQWLIALSYSVLGISELAARLPSTLACLTCVWLTYQIGDRCISREVGWLGGAILAVTPVWMQLSWLTMQDVLLTCIELVGIWALLQAESAPRHRWQWGLLAGSTVGLGFLVKSIMIFLPWLALMPYLVLEQRRHRHLSNGGFYLGLLLGALPVAVWLALAVDRYGWLPLQQLFGKLLFLAQEDFHQVGPLYYFWNIPANAFPWPLVALPGVWWGLRGQNKHRRWLWLGYPLVFLLELTLFKTRTWYYPAQLLPFVALLAALSLSHLRAVYGGQSARRKWLLAFSYATAGLGGLVVLAGLGLIRYPHLAAVDNLPAYGLLAIAVGIGWLLPGLIAYRDRRRPPPQRASVGWQLSWLVAPGSAIALLFATGLWGNYSPEVKMALQTPAIAAVLSQHPVSLVTPQPAEKSAVLLTVYTPTLGQRFDTPTDIPPGLYAWVDPQYQNQLAAALVLGEFRGWHLVQF